MPSRRCQNFNYTKIALSLRIPREFRIGGVPIARPMFSPASSTAGTHNTSPQQRALVIFMIDPVSVRFTTGLGPLRVLSNKFLKRHTCVLQRLLGLGAYSE